MVEIIFIYKWSFSEVESHLKVIDLMGYQPGLEILRYHSPIVTHRFQEARIWWHTVLALVSYANEISCMASVSVSLTMRLQHDTAASSWSISVLTTERTVGAIVAPKASTKKRHVPLNARIPVIHASQAANLTFSVWGNRVLPQGGPGTIGPQQCHGSFSTRSLWSVCLHTKSFSFM